METAETSDDWAKRLRVPAGPGVVAVSGGADSVALLHALCLNSPARPLTVAHLNHQLRGIESDADAEFVSELRPEWPHRIESIDIAKLAAESGRNLEAVAREVRYAFLTRVATEVGASWVATAHTLDDQAETILHRLLRGTGLRGLRGIARERELAPGILLVRPMLVITRTEVIAFLESHGLPWREDATNRDLAFTRNRIRHELLPLMRTFNPAVTDVLGRLAEQSGEVFEVVETETKRLLEASELPRARKLVVFDQVKLANVPEHRLRDMFVAVWAREGWPRDGMTHAHWQRVVDVARGLAIAWDLPDGVRVQGRKNVVRIGR